MALPCGCRGASVQIWPSIRQVFNEPMGVHAYIPTNRASSHEMKDESFRYHAYFSKPSGDREFLGCFSKKENASLAWDIRARSLGWTTVNNPGRVNERSMSEVLKVAFDRYRAEGFPYPPTGGSWRREELDDLLNRSTDEVWRKELQDSLVLQREDDETAPGVELCWSFHPHSMEVSRTRGGAKGERLFKDSPLATFNSDAGLAKAIRSTVEASGDLNFSARSLRKELRFHDATWTFRGQGSRISNFQPLLAAAIYKRYAPSSGGSVFDSSAGWGGRLLGAYAAGMRRYVGCEPSTLTHNGLLELTRFLQEETGKPDDHDGADGTRRRRARGMQVEVHKACSEDFMPTEQFDLAFTSPPYFDSEWYSNEPSQSCLRHPTPEAWIEGFLGPTIRHSLEAVKAGGHLILSINSSRGHRRAGLDLVGEVKRLAKNQGAAHLETLSMLGVTGRVADAKPILVFRKPPP